MKKTSLLLAVLLLLTMLSGVAMAGRVDNSDLDGSEFNYLPEGKYPSDVAASSDIADFFGEVNDSVLIDIINPSFDEIISESTLPIGWELDAYQLEDTFMEVVSDSEHGNCLHIVCSQANDSRAVQKISVMPNSYYRFSCYVKTKGISDSDGAGANISVIGISKAKSESVYIADTWQQIEFIGHTGASQDSVTLGLRIGGYSAVTVGEAWFDDVEVELLKSVPSSFINVFSGSSQSSNTQSNSNSTTTTATTNDSSMPFLSEMILAVVSTALVIIVVYVFVLRKKNDLTYPLDIKNPIPLILILVIAFLLRLMCNFLFSSLKGTFGHSTDIQCFTAWGYRAAAEGASNFYAPNYFCDYPPGYIWVLAICEKIRLFLNLEYASAGHAFIMKLPSIICDLAATCMIYRITINLGKNKRTAIVLASLIAFNPIFIFISAVWGQIDVMLTIFIALSFIMLANAVKDDNSKTFSRLILSGLFYGIAAAIKPQAFMVGPLFAYVYIKYFINCIKTKHNIKVSVFGTILAAVVAFSAIIIPALPFTGSQEGLWLIDKYAGTATSYNYATVEAYNIYTLMGANWKNADTIIFGNISYKILGTIFMAIMVISSIVYYFFGDRKQKGFIFLSSAFGLAGIFTFGHFMHERYLFPVLLLVFIAMIYFNDIRLFIVYGGFSLSMLWNAMGAFIITDYYPAREGFYPTFMNIGAILTIITFVYMCYVCLSLLIRKHNVNPKFMLFKRYSPETAVESEKSEKTDIQTETKYIE